MRDAGAAVVEGRARWGGIDSTAHTTASACVHAGKSTLAQQLASRLNLPNVLQTDLLYEVRVGHASTAWRVTPRAVVGP